MSVATARLTAMLDELGTISDEPGALTRLFLSPAMRRANQRVAAWMRAAGLDVHEDTVGNLIGRHPPTPTRSLARTLVVGSHLDTVRNAGRFDGALGVLLPIVALQELDRRGVQLPFAVEIVGFAEEEGIRFSSAYLGSKGYTGALTAADLQRHDNLGRTLRETLRQFNQGRFRLPRAAHRADELLGFLEVHIEQGPVLEQERLALGVVSAIAGQTRGNVTVRGHAGHAGTTPMALRRDALAAAAELILWIEDHARSHPPLVATVGTLSLPRSAPNVIPGEVTFSVDLRHPDDRHRHGALRAFLDQARRVTRRRRLSLQWSETQDNAAVACSPGLTDVLADSVRQFQRRVPQLPSGAGHDAVVLSRLMPVAMLFVRCRGGLSHHPEEYASPADCEAALNVVMSFLQRLAQPHVRR